MNKLAATIQFLLATTTVSAWAGPPKPAAPERRRASSPAGARESIDRIVVRWASRATGGVARPRFISARELAFEATIDALREGANSGPAYDAKHLQNAIERHVAETMLASLPVTPKPTPKQVANYAEAARLVLERRIGRSAGAAAKDEQRVGRAKLEKARLAEGIARSELDALLRRQARASWYLDKMVAPMLAPSDLDLREAHRRREAPFSSQPFDIIKDQLRQWYITTRLAEALDDYYRSVRTRVSIRLIGPPPRARRKR